jgi:predicted ATPase/DNA-binding SARP family transcriptional activator
VSAPATGPLRLTVLGQVSAPDADGSVLVPVAGLGANLLLALALEHGRGIGAVRAVDEVWPDAPPASGRAALQTLVSRLRSAHGAGLLVSTATGYALGVDPADVDLHRATAAAEQAREALAGGDPGTAERTAGAALALWTGEPGTGATAEPLLAALAVRAEGVRRDLLRLRTRALLDLGDPGAVASADALSEIAPLDDGAHLLRMRALHAAGRTSEAVAAFAEYRERLRDTLGTDPAPEVATFHVELLSEPSAAPVPASSSRVLGLRVAPNALIGRDADVAAVVGLLGAAPVVTVLGTGGLGKTRLVQEVARRSVGRFGAVYVTELSAVREQADVGTVLAEALRAGESAVRLGMAEARVRILRDRVVDRLSEQPTLLVLDNCEHVLDEVAGWVADLIGTVPGLQVLVTSRAPLGVAGERVHPLEPLPAREPDGAPGPAVRLFTERATAVRPGLTLPADVVARLCDRLDGLPLAIELAAARTRSLTVEEVERRLTDRFALLVGGGAGTPERHRTLRAVIEWSWDLLTERQRVLARRVSQLSDGFGADAAAALVAGDGATEQQVLDDLDALVAQSLLRAQEHRPTGTMRYRMLETVREFGDREVDRVGERDRVLDLLLDWGREVALVVVGDMQRPERILLDPVGEREKDNLVTLLRRALDREHATEGPTRRADAITALFAITGVRWVVQGAQEELADVQREVLPLCLGHRPPVGQGAGWTLGLCLIAGTELLYGDLRAGTRARVELRRVVAGRSDLGSVLRLLADLVAHVLDVEQVVGLVAAAARADDELHLRGERWRRRVRAAVPGGGLRARGRRGRHLGAGDVGGRAGRALRADAACGARDGLDAHRRAPRGAAPGRLGVTADRHPRRGPAADHRLHAAGDGRVRRGRRGVHGDGAGLAGRAGLGAARRSRIGGGRARAGRDRARAGDAAGARLTGRRRRPGDGPLAAAGAGVLPGRARDRGAHRCPRAGGDGRPAARARGGRPAARAPGAGRRGARHVERRAAHRADAHRPPGARHRPGRGRGLAAGGRAAGRLGAADAGARRGLPVPAGRACHRAGAALGAGGGSARRGRGGGGTGRGRGMAAGRARPPCDHAAARRAGLRPARRAGDRPAARGAGSVRPCACTPGR